MTEGSIRYGRSASEPALRLMFYGVNKGFLVYGYEKKKDKKYAVVISYFT